MALNVQKISQLPLLTSETTGIKDTMYLSGEEYLMVSYKDKTYKIPTSIILGSIIKTIEQDIVEGDNAESKITMTTDDNLKYSFAVKNGSRGSQGERGETGDKGPRGEHGLILQNDSVEGLVTNDLTNSSSTMIMGAKAGKVLADKISDLTEIYLYHQESFDKLVADNNINDNIKYYIYDEDDVTDEDVDDLTAIVAATIK